jgi:type I restriction enzyme S subunit
MVSLGDLVRISHGYAFKGEFFAAYGTNAIVTPGNFYEFGGFREVGAKQRFYTAWYPAIYDLVADDLIVAMTEQAAGLLGSASFVPKNGHWLHNQRIGRISLISDEVTPTYLFYILNSEAFRIEVNRTAAGTKVKHTSPKKLEEIDVLLPPLAEQKGISEAIDDAHVRIITLERLIAKKQAIKQGMMQQLLVGRTRLPGFRSDWIPQQLGSVLDKLQAGVSVNSVPDPGPHSVLKTSSVSGGEFDPLERKTVAPSDIRRAKVSPRADSLIISRMNTPTLVGEVGYVAADWPTLFLPDRLWLATKRRTASVNMRWLGYMLSSARYRKQLREIATGTSGSMKNIARTAFLQLPVPFPPIEEQAAISSALADLDRDLANYHARLVKANNIKQGMMQQLLTGRTRLPVSEAP